MQGEDGGYMKEDFLLPYEQEKRLEEIFRMHQKGMLRYAYSLIQDEAAAEDIIQEVFIKVAGCMDQIEEAESSHTHNFLFKIVRNCSIDYMRRMKKEWKQTCSLDEDMVVVYDEDVLEIICDSESKRFLREEIGKLKKVYREVLIMKYEQEMSDEEIASKLHISTVNVRIRIHRAKKALSKVIKPDTE